MTGPKSPNQLQSRTKDQVGSSSRVSLLLAQQLNYCTILTHLLLHVYMFLCVCVYICVYACVHRCKEISPYSYL